MKRWRWPIYYGTIKGFIWFSMNPFFSFFRLFILTLGFFAKVIELNTCLARKNRRYPHFDCIKVSRIQALLSSHGENLKYNLQLVQLFSILRKLPRIKNDLSVVSQLSCLVGNSVGKVWCIMISFHNRKIKKKNFSQRKRLLLYAVNNRY